MSTASPPAVPDPLALRDALQRSAPLADLRRRVEASNLRFEQIRPLLPAPLAPHVRPGPLDADGWALLAANVAVAAKLRQLQPRLEAALLGQGWPAVPLRIKVVQPGTGR